MIHGYERPRQPLQIGFHEGASLGAFLAALEDHADKALVLTYDGGRRMQAGYHATEVKVGSFVTLNCGSNPDAWRETVSHPFKAAAGLTPEG